MHPSSLLMWSIPLPHHDRRGDLHLEVFLHEKCIESGQVYYTLLLVASHCPFLLRGKPGCKSPVKIGQVLFGLFLGSDSALHQVLWDTKVQQDMGQSSQTFIFVENESIPILDNV